MSDIALNVFMIDKIATVDHTKADCSLFQDYNATTGYCAIAL